MTKVDIISGFLGAGKTTLIRKLIEEAYQGEKIVLIENEFGEINIDGGFLKDSGVEISEMTAGCICCTLVGDFHDALLDVYHKFRPDRILIEPSGVGKLSDVVLAVGDTLDEEPEISLNSYAVVVDATRVKMFMKNFGEFYNDQIETAGAIILSRTQKMDQDRLMETVGILREKNEDAAILTTPWDELDAHAVVSAMERVSLEEETLAQMRAEHEAHEHEHHHDHDHEHEHHHDHDHEHEHHHDHNHEHHHEHGHHHADEVFDTWGMETPRVYTKEEIGSILDALDDGRAGTVIRAKGIVCGPDHSWIEFDHVPGEKEVRDGKADYTGRFCVIGVELDKEALKELFA